MKNIAVLIYDTTIEYQITIIDGIYSFFEKKKDVNLFIAPVNVPHAITSEFDYQYWTITELLKSRTFDGFIVVANSFTMYYPLEKLEKEFMRFSGKPVVSVAVPLNIEGNSYTCNDSRKAYNQIVEHLVKKHKRKMLTSSLGKIKTLLEYKCERYGKILKKIDRYYPSSQTCSHCGKTYRVGKSETYRCPHCKLIIDRDYNAAINILNYGLTHN